MPKPMLPALLSALLLAALANAPAHAQDTREAAPRTEAERDFILQQMRLFLTSIQAITADLADGNVKAAGEEAYARGRRGNALGTLPPGLKAKETPAWTGMMGGARKGFDDLADLGSSGATPARMMGQLGETMRNCVACHQTYRIVVQN